MKYYLIAGEASGDLHGSNLIKELRKLDAHADIRCWGGDLMEGAGAVLVKHYRDLAFMGFIEVAKNLPTILSNLKFCKGDIQRFQPDVLVLIDYPGFNLRIAKWGKQQGLKIVYYISPQVWAWKESRVKGIRQWVDKMLVILPFEQAFYQKWKYEVDYIGHPLADVVVRSQAEFAAAPKLLTNNKKEYIALLPGSRKQEIKLKLPVMLKAVERFPEYQPVLALAPSIEQAFYTEIDKNLFSKVIGVKQGTYLLLNQAKAALVTSGTATLETALFGVPQVVCYKGSAVSYQIAKRLVKIKYISLVNLIMDKPVVKELIQHELTIENVCRELDAILHDEQRINAMKKDYAELKALLQQGGNASAIAAEKIVGMVNATAVQKA